MGTAGVSGDHLKCRGRKRSVKLKAAIVISAGLAVSAYANNAVVPMPFLKFP